MKRKIKYLLAQFIQNLSPKEREISIQDLSVFFSVLIAIFKLRLYSNRYIQTSYTNFMSDFKNEIQIIKERFPELFKTFITIKAKLSRKLLDKVFIKLNDGFSDQNLDTENIISWSYQFLKKGVEKAAFKKIGKDKAKINNEDLLFTTQFFTDKYMVKYLVDQSLSGFKNKDIQNLVVIDCACGGGNFLNYSLGVAVI